MQGHGSTKTLPEDLENRVHVACVAKVTEPCHPGDDGALVEH